VGPNPCGEPIDVEIFRSDSEHRVDGGLVDQVRVGIVIAEPRCGGVYRLFGEAQSAARRIVAGSTARISDAR
jgi:hypothetical protein